MLESPRLVILRIQTILIHTVSVRITIVGQASINIVRGKGVGDMEVHFPVFTVDRDGWMHMAVSPAALNHYEQIDIEGAEYSVWDVRGRPIRLSWARGVGAKVEVADEAVQLDQLRAAIEKYALMAAPNTPFTCHESCDDVVELFQAVERHIELDRPSLMKRMRRLLKGKRSV